MAGALASGAASDVFLKRFLAIVAIAAALLGGRRKGIRNLPDPALGPDDVGEHAGSLSGAYPLGDGVVPYRARAGWAPASGSSVSPVCSPGWRARAVASSRRRPRAR